MQRVPDGERQRLRSQAEIAVEAKLMLATILARYQLDLFPGEHLTLKPSVTLRPKKSVRVRVRERSAHRLREISNAPSVSA